MDTGAHLGQLFRLNNYVTKTGTMVCAPGQVEVHLFKRWKAEFEFGIYCAPRSAGNDHLLATTPYSNDDDRPRPDFFLTENYR